MRSVLVIVVLASLFAASFHPAAGTQPAGPVLNGGFDLPTAGQAAVLDGTPVDECTGVGHQVLWGTGSWQAKAADPQPSYDVDASALVLDPGHVLDAYAEGRVGAPGATGAAQQVADDPAGEAAFFAGYGHCVWSNEDGKDVVWLQPVERATNPFGWSFEAREGQVRSIAFTDANADGDREAVIGNPAGSGHNMWQVLHQQAWSGDFAALFFRVEAGSVPPSAAVILSLTTTPLQRQHPWAGVFLDCALRFSAAQLQPGPGGFVAVDPAAARLTKYWEGCDAEAASWPSLGPAQRHDLLGRMRMVQLSFWNFNNGPGVVLDDVELVGASLAAEQASQGNANAPNPFY